MARKLIFGQTLGQAIPLLDEEARVGDLPPLEGLDPETAFRLGMETMVHRLKEITGPDPSELELRVVEGLDGIVRADGEEIGGLTTHLEERL